MFAFKNKHIGQIKISGLGENASGSRRFGILGLMNSLDTRQTSDEAVQYELSSIPDRERYPGTPLIGDVFNPSDNTAPLDRSDNSSDNLVTDLNNTGRIYFLNNDFNIPVTENFVVDYLVYNKNKIRAILINGGAQSENINNLDQFTEAVTVSISVVPIQEIGTWPRKIESINLSILTSLNSIGPLPNGLKFLRCVENTLLGDQISSRFTSIDDLIHIRLASDDANQFISSRTNSILGASTGFTEFDISSHLNIEELHVNFNNTLVSGSLPLVSKVITCQIGFAQIPLNKEGLTALFNPNLEKLKIARLDVTVWDDDLDGSISPNLVFLSLSNAGYAGNLDLSTNSNLALLKIDGTLNSSSLSSLKIPTSGALNSVVLVSILNAGELDFTTTSSIDTVALDSLDLTNSPNLKAQLNTISSIQFLQLTNVAGIGGNLDISNLTTLSNLLLSNSTLSGIITLSASPLNTEIQLFQISGNPGLTDVVNFDQLTKINGNGGGASKFDISNTGLNLDISNLTDIRHFSCVTCPNQVELDFSNVTINTARFYQIVNNASLTTIRFPFSGLSFSNPNGADIIGNPILTVIENFDKLIIQGGSGPDIRNNTLLNIPIPFKSSFYWNVMNFSSNSIDQLNIDQSIGDLYLIRSTFGARTLNISGGSNAVPSGVFQAPTGFVLMVSDGVPNSPQEEMFVMVNNYSSTFITN